MKQYRVIISVPKVILINANSEEEVIKMVQEKVLQKPSDPYDLKIVEEVESNE